MTKYRIVEEIKGTSCKHYVEERNFMFWSKISGMDGVIYYSSLDEALCAVRSYTEHDIQKRKKVIKTVISHHGD